MKKSWMILLFCCYSTQIFSLESNDAPNYLSLLLGVMIVGAVYKVCQDTVEAINYWIKPTNLVCIDCKDSGKYASKLTELPCGYAACCLCKQAKVDVANRHNSKLDNICRENLVYPLCSCEKKFDFDHQKQRQLCENNQVAASAIRPFAFTLITNRCVNGCGNKISQVLDCGHSVSIVPCITSFTSGESYKKLCKCALFKM